MIALTFHNKYTIIPRLVIEDIKKAKPLVGPFGRPIAPLPGPFSFAPGVPDENKPFTLVVYCFQDGIGVIDDQTMNFKDLPPPTFLAERGHETSEEVAITNLDQK